MSRLLMLIAVALPLAMAAPRAQSQPTGFPRPDTLILPERYTDLDREFLERSAQAHHTELQIATLAITRARDVRIRQLAPHLLRDHEIELGQLARIAEERGVALPEITEMQQETIERLRELEGDSFDRAFIAQVINEHRDQYGLYRDVSENPNLDIRSYGERRIPSIREHLQRTQDIYPMSVLARWTISNPK
jgi:putative membrane protein